MSYIKNSLSRDEGEVEIFRFHWLRWFWFILWIVLAVASLAFLFLNHMIALFTFVPFVMLAIYEYVKLINIEMGVTNKRVIYKEGIISRITKEMKLTAIENITIHQSFFERILNIGKVKVIGRAATPVEFKDVKDPVGVKRSIENHIPPSAGREDDLAKS